MICRRVISDCSPRLRNGGGPGRVIHIVVGWRRTVSAISFRFRWALKNVMLNRVEDGGASYHAKSVCPGRSFIDRKSGLIGNKLIQFSVVADQRDFHLVQSLTVFAMTFEANEQNAKAKTR